MKFLIPSLDSNWANTDRDPNHVDEEFAQRTAEDNSEGLKNFLAKALGAQNLLVLAGSGTSMCVKDPAGNALAPDMNVLWNRCKDRIGQASFEALLDTVKYDLAMLGENIEYLLSQCHLAFQFTGADAIRNRIAEFEAEIATACSFISSEVGTQVHESFLRKVARRSVRLPRACVFTTNYDLCFETASSRAGFIVIDGFSYTSERQFSPHFLNYDFVKVDPHSGKSMPVPNVVKLMKLHGSVDWQYDDGIVTKIRNSTAPHLIYPQASKYESSYKRPFFDIMSQFHALLRSPDTTALIVGFGFNDNHITAPVLAAIRENVNLRLLIVSPDLEQSDNSNIDWIRSLGSSGDSRINLIASTFPEFTKEIPDLVANLNDEVHRERVTAV